MKSENAFKRWNLLLKEVQTQKLNSAERMKENNNCVFVPADQTGSRTEPNKSVISQAGESGEVLETKNTKVTREIQNNIRNLWED